MISQAQIDARIAIVLFNLGGPDSLKAVRPFLYNLFSDDHIIRLPSPLRQFIAYLIAFQRFRFAQKNYALIGGRSPLFENTQAQAQALEKALKQNYPNAKTFIAMRYWHPLTKEVVQSVNAFNPDKIVLLPLYPHYSTTTTKSSFLTWQLLAKQFDFKTHTICCYFEKPEFITAHADLLAQQIKSFPNKKNYHILFSAHGVPIKIIKAGDPYQRQIESSARAIAHRLNLLDNHWSLSYQSRVGPLKWLAPETASEITRLGLEKNIDTLFLVPLSFVSEHIETLVELDMEFKQLAHQANIKHFIRIPTLSCHHDFIACLTNLVHRSLQQDELLCSDITPCLQNIHRI